MPVNVQGDFGAWCVIWRGQGTKGKRGNPAVLVAIEPPYVHYGGLNDYSNGWVERWICNTGRTIRVTRKSPSPDGWLLQHLGVRDVLWDVADAPWGIPPWDDAPDGLREVVEIWVRPQGIVTLREVRDAVGISSEGWEWLL